MKHILWTFFILSCSSIEKKTTDPVITEELNEVERKDQSSKVTSKLKKYPFIEKAKDYGLDNIKAYNFNVVDFNGDGYSDLMIIPSFFSAPEFYQFEPQSKKFVKIGNLIDQPDRISFALFSDLNQDGILDMVTGVLNQDSELSKKSVKIYNGYKNEKGLRFSLKQDLNLTSPVSTIGLIDINLDGYLDLFIGNWLNSYKQTKLPVHDLLYIYDQIEKKYTNHSSLLTGETKQNLDKTMFTYATPTYASQICDIDRNGYPDILTTSTNRFHNKLWMNRFKFREKERYFEDIAVESGVASDPDGLIHERGGGRTFSAACADYNQDLIMDIFLGELTHNYDDESVDKSSLLTGRTFKYPPRFFRTEYFLDSFDPDWHQADRRAIWVDLNNDGLLDLIVDNSGYPPYSKLIVFTQEEDHSFVNVSQAYGVDLVNPVATVIIDINQDGKMDILTAQSEIRDAKLKNRIYLYENKIENTNSSIRFYLMGESSNLKGLNGSISLTVVKNKNQLSQRIQQVVYSYGALPAQNEEGILFGIKNGETPLKVTVTWPFSSTESGVKSSMEVSYKLKDLPKGEKKFILCESGKILTYSSQFDRENCRLK